MKLFLLSCFIALRVQSGPDVPCKFKQRMLKTYGAPLTVSIQPKETMPIECIGKKNDLTKPAACRLVRDSSSSPFLSESDNLIHYEPYTVPADNFVHTVFVEHQPEIQQLFCFENFCATVNNLGAFFWAKVLKKFGE